MKKTYITTMPNHIGAFLKEAQEICPVGEWKIFGSHGAMREYNLILNS